MRAIDVNGIEVEFGVLAGPSVLVTPEGEFCAEEGQVVVKYPNMYPLVLSQEQFDQQFTEV